MNRSIARSLFRDALYQVVDNLGFRILGVLFLVPVVLTFLIGFRENGLWIAFHWHWTWEEVVSGLGIPTTDPSGQSMLSDVREGLLQTMIKLIVDYVADRFGFVFGIAAISFFVPQMLEKGAADVVFSKPVSRATLFLSRYFAGLLFVGILSAAPSERPVCTSSVRSAC